MRRGAERPRVLVYLSRSGDFVRTHEGRALLSVAASIARLKRAGEVRIWSEALHRPGGMYLVPSRTLMTDEAERLGIRSPSDLFGGVVPHPFVPTKAITHALVDDGAARPRGWSQAFAARVRDVVLPGYTVFTARDAALALGRLLEQGPRAKRTLAAGGQDQWPVRAAAELDRVLERIPDDELAQYGLLLETNLTDVTTLSIGQVVLDDTTMSYCGTQRLTTDNEGQATYGGSDLMCARGGWSALDRLPLPAPVRHAVAQARVYDEATAEYEGFMASRRNYDVGQGLDSAGRWRSGVLEASWRVGGATGAEVGALGAFIADPSLDRVHAASVVEFGRTAEPAADALVHFRGEDPRRGPMVQYTVVSPAPA